MATVRAKLTERLNILTYKTIIESFVLWYDKYFDPSLEAPARLLKIGAEIERTVTEGPLNPYAVGKAICAESLTKDSKPKGIGLA